MPKALLDIPDNIVLLLGYIADEIKDTSLIITPELEICAEHLCFIDQIVRAHDILDFKDHWCDNLSVYRQQIL